MTFTGRLGNLIGYQRNGQYFLRSMPETVHQTIATRHAAKRFGVASQRGALIRHAFYADLDICCDNSHVNRLNKMLIAAGNNTAVTGFRFNQHTGINHFFGIAPTLSRDEILHLAPQGIARHKGITALEVKVIAVRINFVTRQVTGSDVAVMMIDPRHPFTGADIPLEVSGNGTLIVTLQVRGMYPGNASCNQRFLAADIVAVLPRQVAERSYKRTYTRHTRAHRLPQQSTLAYPSLTGIQRE